MLRYFESNATQNIVGLFVTINPIYYGIKTCLRNDSSHLVQSFQKKLVQTEYRRLAVIHEHMTMTFIVLRSQ